MTPAYRIQRQARTRELGRQRSKPFFIIPAAIVLFLLLGLGPNVTVALLACLVLIIGTFLLWRPGEPQILLFLFAVQLLQPSVPLVYANWTGLTLVDFMPAFPGIERAITLVLLGLLFLAIGIRLGVGRQKPSDVLRFRETLSKVDTIGWLQLHLGMFAVSTVALLLAQAVPGLYQPLLALSNFKWATFLMYTISTFTRRDGSRVIWFAVFSIEFLMSLGGYFSSFKLVFLYTLIASTAVSAKISIKQVAGGAVVAVVMLTAGLYWTAIKPDYRSFVNAGTGQQIVEVSRGDAILEIVNLVNNVTSDQLLEAGNTLSRRFSEVDVFSAVVVNVPSVIPHEWGTLWVDAVSRPFMPRILFPNKAIIDDSELTNRYVSVQYAGLDKGTQVSMGYIADSYIDFGEYGMMGVILVFGYFVGCLFRWMFSRPNETGSLGLALASVTFIQLSSIGSSSAKIVGGILVSFLVSLIILSLAPLLMRLLLSRHSFVDK